MQARKHLLVVAVMAAVAGSALFLHVHLPRGHLPARPEAARAAEPTGRGIGGSGASADPLAAQDLPAGPLRLEGQAVDADHQPIAGATITLDGRRTAITEADGAFAFDHLAEGSHRVAAEKDVLYAEDSVALSASSEPAVLTLQPGATLVIHVVADGQPLAGAQVEVMYRKASTDATGTVRFRGVELSATFAHVTADHLAPQKTRIVTGDDPHAVIEQTIALGHAAPVSGRVVDPDGAPVPGADVSYAMTGASWTYGVTADLDGRWQIDLVGAGQLVLSARSSGHIPAPDLVVPVDGEHPRTDVIVRVERGATITGAVVDARGKPVPDAEVTCETGTASVDDHGRFECTGQPPGEGFLFATTHTLGSPIQKLEIPPGGRLETRLVLSDTVIAGRVKNQRGEPVADAYVRAHGADGVGWTSEVSTDEHGKFEVTGLPASNYELITYREGEKQDPPSVTVHSGNHRVALVLPEAATVTGRVLLDGKPASYFGVKILENPHDGLGAPEAVRSPDGRFATSGLRAGSWSLVIAGPDFVRKVLPGVRVRDGQTTDLGDIAVTRGRSISGHVRDERGQPIAGAQITLNDSGLRSFDYDTAVDAAASGEWMATTDASGAYHIDGIPSEASGLQIGATDAHRAAPPRPVPRGSTVDLVLAATGELRGVVVNEHGRNTVRVVGADQHTYDVTTSETHEFTIPRLPPGNYAVELHGRMTSMPIYTTVTAGGVAQVRFEEPPVPVRLVVRAAASRACKAASLTSIESNGIAGHVLYDIDCETMDCEGGTVEFFGLAPGVYRLCARGAPCQDVEVAASPAVQQATVRPAQAPR